MELNEDNRPFETINLKRKKDFSKQLNFSFYFQIDILIVKFGFKVFRREVKKLMPPWPILVYHLKKEQCQ